MDHHHGDHNQQAAPKQEILTALYKGAFLNSDHVAQEDERQLNQDIGGEGIGVPV